MTVLGFSVGHDKGAVIVQNNKVAIGISQKDSVDLNMMVHLQKAPFLLNQLCIV